jgi:hypothetical protein
MAADRETAGSGTVAMVQLVSGATICVIMMGVSPNAEAVCRLALLGRVAAATSWPLGISRPVCEKADPRAESRVCGE